MKRVLREWPAKTDFSGVPVRVSYPARSAKARVLAVETRYEVEHVPKGRYVEKMSVAYPVLLIMDEGPDIWDFSEMSRNERFVIACPDNHGPNATLIPDDAGRYLGSALDRGRRVWFFEPRFEESRPPPRSAQGGAGGRPPPRGARAGPAGPQPSQQGGRSASGASGGTYAPSESGKGSASDGQRKRESSRERDPFDVG
jgi:hypothetical protein